jgi:hypothetical protein
VRQLTWKAFTVVVYHHAVCYRLSGEERRGVVAVKWKVLIPMLGSLFPVLVNAQTQTAPLAPQATPLVARAIDETKLATLKGSVHPLAQARYDRGAVADSFAAERVILLLNRPPEREAALERFLQDAHSRGAASYHQWLTPERFGEQFGPADADIQTASGWLSSHGFRVARVAKSKGLIEFSGTAGELREAFHTEIHRYSIAGETHYANASEISIPEALVPLVRGLSPLNSFYAKSNLRVVGPASYSRSTGKTTPHWTLPYGTGSFYAVAPEDFATQYDLAPLYQAGVNGAGQTIGIINESNVDLSLVQAYQKLFGLSGPTPQVVVDGADPGTVSGVDIEAYLDIEEAGAVAPGATVNLYISDASTLTDPLYLAALRAVEDNQASVLSVSFGSCEGFMLQAGNALWSDLWEQAAAQGQTVLVSSGDSGSAGCDDGIDEWEVAYGLAVNGLASTPWNVAVGGTDFYYSDFATGGASAAKLWNQTNDANSGSLKAPLPEQVWDTAFGLNATGRYVQSTSVSIPGGGGGASGCINSFELFVPGSALPFVCNTVSGTVYDGTAKPSWQNVPGVPADGVRDIPDVALFASNGLNFSAYPICASAGDCVADAGGQEQITLVGGTSAPTPAMAGILALVNQKYGRQGQANFTLYPLARQRPAAFHDVTLGSNNVPCEQGTPNCSLDKTADGFYSLQEYPAGVGYDLASGLGSVDASVLVNNWNSVSFQATTTTLQVTPATASHGSSVGITVDVKPSSGSGTPQGNVTILNNSPTPLSAGQGVLAIGSNGSASGSLNDLPGGTYQVWAQYAGDGTFASSQSAPQTVTIAPAGSSLNLLGFVSEFVSFNPASPCWDSPNAILYNLNGVPVPSGSTLPTFWQIAAVAVANGGANGGWPSFGTGTGNVTFTLDGTPAATVNLNSQGYATFIPPTELGAGLHSIGATYSGDASYAASTAAPYTITVSQAATFLSVWPAGNCTGTYDAPLSCAFSAGDNLPVEVQLYSRGCHAPTGTVTVNLGSLTQNVTLSPGGLYRGGEPVMLGEAVFQNLPAGTYPLSATYAGDANSLALTAANSGFNFTVVATAPPAPLLPTTTTVVVNPNSLSYPADITSNVYFTATVTGGSGSTAPPTGTVTIFDDGAASVGASLTPFGTNSATVVIGPALGDYFDFGSSQIKAIYSGDSVYQASAATPFTFSNTISQTPDFLLAQQLPQITVQPGGSGTAGFNLTSMDGFNGVVTLSCAPSSSLISCSVNPATVTLNGQATATLTINAVAQTAELAPAQRQRQSGWPVGAGMLAFGLFFVGGRAHRKLRRSVLLSLILFAAILTIGCGIWRSTGTPTPTPTPAPTLVSYSVVVTGTANGIVHNAKITVVIP